MKIFWTLFLTVACLNAQALTLTTFNIRWFGLGGTMDGTLKDEKRGKHLRDFIDNVSKISQSDVIALQEIVDQNKIRTFFPNHTCTSYQHQNPKHQYVMICVKKPLKLVMDGGDKNFIWEDIAAITMPDEPTVKLRPAVHGTVQDVSGKALIHVVAVHLKAEPEQTDVRLEQTRRLKKHIENDYKDQLPVVILGDFNTHIKKLTGLKKDDAVMMDELFRKGQKPLTLVPNTQYTFRSDKVNHKLDHYWISGDIKSTTPKVWPECQKGVTGSTFMNHKFYYKEVSDHCPVSVELTKSGKKF